MAARLTSSSNVASLAIMPINRSSNILMTNALIRFQLSLVLTLLLGLSTTVQGAQVEQIDYIVAVVDEDVILFSELNGEILKIVAQLNDRGARIPPREVLERQMLERLILEKLQLAKATQLGISVGEDILSQAVGNIARRNEMSLSEFRQALEESGISFRGYREGIRNQIIISRLLEQEVQRRIRVSDQEVRSFIAKQEGTAGNPAEYHLFHILIATPEGATPDELEAAHAKAERLVQELRSGLDFSTAALTESDGRQALEGGDLGWRPANQIPTVAADIIAEMERGEISDPIRSPSGYHIVKLADYRGGERKIINQTHARHILVTTNEITSDDEARVRLEQLKQRIEGGDDFATLARSNSDDKSSAIKGGDLGWVTPGDLVPRFEEEMNSLALEQISAPFRTEFGWHIVQVLARREHDSTETIEKTEAREAISKRKFTEESALYLRRLRDEAYVEIRLSEF